MIYLSLERQLVASQQDLAKTINSTSNQQKIFAEQTQRLAVAFGRVLSPVVTTVTTYLNGLLMVITELLNMFATFIGIEMPEYDPDSYKNFNDLTDYLDDATSSAGKLKKELNSLRGFDKLNVIRTPKDSSGGSGGLGTGAVDKRLLEALKEYDLGMDNIHNKATQIRDAIMDWLGFSKDVNGEWQWSEKTLLKNIWNWWNKLNTAGKIFIGLGIAKTLGGIWNATKKLSGATGLTKLFGITKKGTSSFKSLTDYVKLYSNIAKKEGYTGTKKLTSALKEGTDAWSKNLTKTEKLNNTLIGGGGLLISFGLVSDAAKKFNETGEYTTGVIANLAGGLAGGTLSGAAIGATWGGAYGAVIGALAGLAIEGVGYLSQLESEQDKVTKVIADTTQKIKEENEEYSNFFKQIDNNTQKQVDALERDKQYLAQLQSITDENGKIKKGYEDRARVILTQLNEAYGTEYELSGNVITNNGKVITSYEEIEKSIDKVIEKKKLEIILEANREKYAYALEHQTEMYDNYQLAIENSAKAHENLAKQEKKVSKQQEIVNKSWSTGAYWIEKSKLSKLEKKYKDLEKATKDADDELTKAKDNWVKNTETMVKYNGLMEANITGDSEKIKRAITEMTTSGNKSISEQIQMWKDYGDEVAKQTGKVEDDTYAMLDATINTLKNQSTSIENITPEIVDGWGKLSQTSKEKFVENFNSLPEDVKRDLIPRLNDAGYNISESFKVGMTSGASGAGQYMIQQVESGASQEVASKKKNGTLLDIGKNILAGIVTGMQPKKNTFGSWATNVGKSIMNVLGIHSPSRLMQQLKIGDYLVQGIEVGMYDEIPYLAKVVTSMADTIQSEIDKTQISGFNIDEMIINKPDLDDYDFPENNRIFTNTIKNLETTDYVSNPNVSSSLRQSTFNGMMDALSVTSQQNQNINLTIIAEDDGILNNIKFKEKQHDRQYGF